VRGDAGLELIARPYAGRRDLPRVLDLLADCEASGLVDMELRSIELRLALENPSLDRARHTLLLAAPDGDLLGFGILWQGHYLGLLVHPRERGRLEERMLAWALDETGDERLWILCRSDDAVMRAFYERRGFVVADEELRMARDLDRPIPEPAVPAGFTVQPLADDEIEAWLALYADAFGPRETALRKWRAYRADPDYDRSLDLVAVDRRGELAALGTCTVASLEAARSERPEGRTEPIAVRERDRGRGLGRAMVLSGLRLLRARGMAVAALTTEVDNAGAHRLYRTLSYREIYRARWYARRG
jgi:mycothiol synthase